MRAAKELIRQKLMDITHKNNWWLKKSQQVNPWREICLTILSMLRNPRKTGKSEMLVILCKIVWNDPFSVPFPICSVILECPRVGHSFSYWQKQIPGNFIVLKQNYCLRAVQSKKRENRVVPIICQSAPCLVDIVTQQPLGWFTPNQVNCDYLGMHMHNIMVTCPSLAKCRVAHLADT